MSKLNVDQKTIKDLFQDKKADFLIPDYQRPYAWGETECQTLWDDIFTLPFQMMDVRNLIPTVNTSLAPLSPLRMMTQRWKSSMDSSA